MNGGLFMKRNPNYLLYYLADKPYLLPYGQMIASHRHGIMINATGAAIWNLLAAPLDFPELIRLLAQEYQISLSQQPEFEQDVHAFIDQLTALGIIEDTPENAAPHITAGFARYLKIAGLNLKLCGPQEAFSGDFDLFTISYDETDLPPSSIDQTILVTEEEPLLLENGTYILRDYQLCIYETAGAYRLLFPASDQLREAYLYKDGTRAVFYCRPPYGEQLVYDLFHAIRIVFLYLAEKHRMYAIHSASICYREKAWLFSGPSGTGKSTHTNLWKEYFSTPVINGDLNLLAICDGTPVIHGIPWCGTSGICDAHTYPLGGIVFLKQDETNRLIPLSSDEKQLSVMHRMISPLWKQYMMEELLAFVTQLSAGITIHKLGCTISKEAVTTIKDAIDAS